MTSFEKGLMCRLTKKKPDFTKTCSHIQLDEKFIEKLENAILELHMMRQVQLSNYIRSIFIITIGVLLIIGSDFLAEQMHRGIYFWVDKLTAICFGISIVSGGYYNLSRFRGELTHRKQQKNKIDTVLDRYGISYTSNIDFKEKIHGTQKISVQLEFKNWTKKSTTTIYDTSY